MRQPEDRYESKEDHHSSTNQLDIELICSSLDEFRRVITNAKKLCAIVLDCPEEHYDNYRNRVVNFLLNNPAELIPLIQSAGNLCRIVRIFPELREKLTKYFLEHVDKLVQMIQYAQGLSEIVEKFPAFRQKLIEYFLNNFDQLKPLIQNLTRNVSDNLNDILKALPELRSMLIKYFFNHIPELGRMIRYVGDLLSVLKIFPQFRGELIQYFKDHPSELRRIINNNASNLDHIVMNLEGFHLTLTECFINHIDELGQAIRDTHQLCEVAKKFSALRQGSIQYFLNDPTELERIMKSDTHLSQLAQAFPEHSVIFGKATVKEAYQEACRQHASQICPLLQEESVSDNQGSALFDFGVSNDMGCIVLECLYGGDVLKYLYKGGGLFNPVTNNAVVDQLDHEKENECDNSHTV